MIKMVSQHVQEKAERLVAERWVFELFRGFDYSTFVVEGDTNTYQVRLRRFGLVSCTYPGWKHHKAVCSHIRVSQLYHNPPLPEVPKEDEPELTLEEISALLPKLLTSSTPKLGGKAQMICVVCGDTIHPEDPDAFYSERWVCPTCGFRYPEDW